MSPISNSLDYKRLTDSDEANTINVKLFPVFRAPSPVKAYHVPICTVQLESLMDMNWDMTLQKVSKFASKPLTDCRLFHSLMA